MVLSLLNRFCNLIISKSEWICDLILVIIFYVCLVCDKHVLLLSKTERHDINFHQIMDIVLEEDIIKIFTLGHKNMGKWYCYLSFHYISSVLCCLFRRHGIIVCYILCIITFSDLFCVTPIPITKLFIA